MELSKTTNELKRDFDDTHGFFDARLATRKEKNFVIFFSDELRSIWSG